MTIGRHPWGTGMWALRKAPEKLNGNQRTALASIAADDERACMGYLIKEQLREAFKVKGEDEQEAAAGHDRLGAPLPDAPSSPSSREP